MVIWHIARTKQELKPIHNFTEETPWQMNAWKMVKGMALKYYMYHQEVKVGTTGGYNRPKIISNKEKPLVTEVSRFLFLLPENCF
jgi:hypothetical protein